MNKPPFITTDEFNSFAAFTVTNRLPAIVRSVIDNNNFDNKIADKLEDLFRNIPEGDLKELPDSSGINRKINSEIHSNKYRWNKAPFIFAENYLYHLLKEICHYPETTYDYFAFKKNSDIVSKKDALLKAIANYKNLAEPLNSESLKPVLYSYLSGNAADLSQMGASYGSSINLLIDDSDKIKTVLTTAKQIDIVLDNSGEELLYDLLFLHWLLSSTNTTKVNLHFKTFPYFVSDALIKDFYFLLEELSRDKNGKDFAGIIESYITAGNLVLYDDNFWTDANDYSVLPESIKSILSESDLIVFKGDLNYRKLIEDRHWSFTQNTAGLTGHIATTCLIIRVLKSEIITGLKSVPVTGNNEWMYNSKYGIIQLVKPLGVMNLEQ